MKNKRKLDLNQTENEFMVWFHDVKNNSLEKEERVIGINQAMQFATWFAEKILNESTVVHDLLIDAVTKRTVEELINSEELYRIIEERLRGKIEGKE